MIHPVKPQPSIEAVNNWLTKKYRRAPSGLSALRGGFWASAFAYDIDAVEYVLRLSNFREGFEIDQAAMQFKTSNLPIPEVLEVGEALGVNFAISRRHNGEFIETIAERDAESVGNVLTDLLTTLRLTPVSPNAGVLWYQLNPSNVRDWHTWLRSGLIDDPDSLISGWREKLRKESRLDRLFRECESRIEELLPLCPDRNDLVHGDLLHQNVLVNADISRVTAIFSWKCSVLGDYLFDVAWCTFWGYWHPAIEKAEIWERTLATPDLRAEDLQDASTRHHCYELQIAASHFAWNAGTGNYQELQRLADVTERVLQRGPLSP